MLMCHTEKAMNNLQMEHIIQQLSLFKQNLKGVGASVERKGISLFFYKEQ